MTNRTITIPSGVRVSLAAYTAAWRRVKDNPGAVVNGWDAFPVTGADVRAEMARGMHDRINRRGGVTVRPDGELWWAWRRDQRAIQDYRLHRIVRRGSGLETKAGRNAAPDVHDVFRDLA